MKEPTMPIGPLHHRRDAKSVGQETLQPHLLTLGQTAPKKLAPKAHAGDLFSPASFDSEAEKAIFSFIGARRRNIPLCYCCADRIFHLTEME
jgi:hypothetical protein